MHRAIRLYQMVKITNHLDSEQNPNRVSNILAPLSNIFTFYTNDIIQPGFQWLLILNSSHNIENFGDHYVLALK